MGCRLAGDDYDGVNPADQLDAQAAHVRQAALDFREAAARPGSSLGAPATLAPLEEALQAISAGWYQLAGDALPLLAARRRLPETVPPPKRPHSRLSREQEVRLTTTLHDLASAFARCARACRKARPIAAPLIAPQSNAIRSGHEAQPPSPAGRTLEAGIFAQGDWR
jgi:hypothetical protein